MSLKIKAGQFVFDKQTGKVKVSKDKGMIHIHRNEDQQTHFKWVNLDKNQEQMDIIVFPGDAVFEAVVGKNNTYVLRFGMDDDRYFFWLQEKKDPESVISQVNQLINFVEDQENMKPNVESVQQAMPDKPVQPEKKAQISQETQDFIAKFTKSMERATQKIQMPITSITHLSEVITPEAISIVLNEFNEEQKSQLVEFLPEEQKKVEYLPSNLRSPQFQQALDALSDALNSENAIPLFMELGLDQTFLQKYYGVEAFLLALVEWAKQNEKK